MAAPFREGILYGLAAYGWWGLVPLYFRWLGPVSPLEVLAHRIVWSAIFLAVVLVATGRIQETARCLATPKLFWPLTLSALFVGANWLMYNLSVYLEVIVQASLGYFILPLVSILFAVAVFREKIRPLQYLAIAFAFVGVGLLTLTMGHLPWLALAIALTFSVYGMIRKFVPVDGLTGLTVETIVLAPIALLYLVIVYGCFQDFVSLELLIKLALGGPVTAIPLLCFGQAARRLPLSALGFMQYISPSMQFLIAVFLFDEPVTGGWLNYELVWIALVIFSFDSYLWYTRPSGSSQ